MNTNESSIGIKIGDEVEAVDVINLITISGIVEEINGKFVKLQGNCNWWNIKYFIKK